MPHISNLNWVAGLVVFFFILSFVKFFCGFVNLKNF